MSPIFRKTVLTEAHQWFKNGDHPDDMVGEILHDPWARHGQGDDYERLEGLVVRFFRLPPPGPRGVDIHEVCGRTWHDHGWIDTLEGGHNVCPGDWIATSVHGEHWPIKPDVLAESYEMILK
jgi:hypothetical protein